MDIIETSQRVEIPACFTGDTRTAVQYLAVGLVHELTRNIEPDELKGQQFRLILTLAPCEWEQEVDPGGVEPY